MATIRYNDASDRGKLRFTGVQRAWFLHQIVTRSFEDIDPGEARSGAMLTAKGRMVGFFEAVASDNTILMHFEPSLRESFPDEFRRYVFATQVEIEDVSEEMGLVLLVGEGWRDLTVGVPATAHPATTWGVDAGYLWVRRSDLGTLLEELAASAEPIDERELEDLRIKAGVPRWGLDMGNHTIPQEARLEEIGALDLDKGCYVGQETVAKIHFRGKVNRTVRSIEAEEDLVVGADVTIDDENCGVVTSASGTRALAVLKHTVETGQKVTIGTLEATVIS